MKTLVIVESPGKIEKIQSILGDKYCVIASYGHIIDLDPNTMSINSDFEPNYIVCNGKQQVINKIKTEYKKCDDIILATDKDREGEMIAWSVAKELNLKNPKRIKFPSYDKQTVLKSVKTFYEIDENMVNGKFKISFAVAPCKYFQISSSIFSGRSSGIGWPKQDV